MFKHDDVKYQFLPENLRNGRATLQYTPTKQTVADFVSKDLQEQRFKPLVYIGRRI